MANEKEQIKEKGSPWELILLIIAVIGMIVLAIYVHIGVKSLAKDYDYNMIASATIGAIMSALVTFLLLQRQTKLEERLSREQREADRQRDEERSEREKERDKERQRFEQELAGKQSKLQSELLSKQTDQENKSKRDLENYNLKRKAYSEFVYQMYEILSDNNIVEKEILELRTRIFGQLSFYAEGNILESINNELKDIKDYTIVDLMQRKFANIANILQKDLRGDDWHTNVQSSYNLWTTFDSLLDDSETNSTDKLNNNVDTENPETSNFLNNTFWHFAMWGEEQLVALSEGIYELNLVEYGEEWRTNLMRQVRKDDLVFLFRSGGPGYMGVFRAKGRRIFEFNEKTTETVNMFGESEKVITDENQVTKDRVRSDIYESLDDGASLCSSLIVEPLAFARDGIENPGGTYRRTISRYDHNYGLMQLARFMAIKDDDTIFNVFNNKPMGCNKELFEQILASGNIQPAPRDENGNWID